MRVYISQDSSGHGRPIMDYLKQKYNYPKNKLPTDNWSEQTHLVVSNFVEVFSNWNLNAFLRVRKEYGSYQIIFDETEQRRLGTFITGLVR